MADYYVPPWGKEAGTRVPQGRLPGARMSPALPGKGTMPARPAAVRLPYATTQPGGPRFGPAAYADTIAKARGAGRMPGRFARYAGPLGAALGAGYGIGTLLDRELGISDRIAQKMIWRDITEEMNKKFKPAEVLKTETSPTNLSDAFRKKLKADKEYMEAAAMQAQVPDFMGPMFPPSRWPWAK